MSIEFKPFGLKVCRFKIHFVSAAVSCRIVSSLSNCWGTICYSWNFVLEQLWFFKVFLLFVVFPAFRAFNTVYD